MPRRGGQFVAGHGDGQHRQFQPRQAFLVVDIGVGGGETAGAGQPGPIRDEYLRLAAETVRSEFVPGPDPGEAGGQRDRGGADQQAGTEQSAEAPIVGVPDATRISPARRPRIRAA